MLRDLAKLWVLLPSLLLACADAPAGAADGDASAATTTGEPTTTTAASVTGELAPTTDATTDAGPAIDPDQLLLSDRVLNIAHRGGRDLRPEETLIAYAHAIEVGADVLEMDLHATADGVVVLMHDDSVDRTTSGTGKVAAMTLSELKALDAGYHFTRDGGLTFPHRGQGVAVPTLEEVLYAFPDQVFLMEIKQSEPPIVDEVLAILAAHDLGSRVVIASFDTATIEAVRAGAPALHTAMSLDELLALLAHLGDPDYAPPARFVQSPWELSSSELINFSHALGLKVHPWTVNGGALMDTLIARGVDGIMTDDPALLAAHLPAP